MKNRIQLALYKLYSCMAFAAPLAALYGINYQSYIGHSDGGMTISFWVYVGAIFVVIAAKEQLGSVAKKDPLLTVILAVLTTSLIMKLLAEQLLLISSMSLIGWGLYKGVSKVVDVYDQHCYRLLANNKRQRINTAYLPIKQAWHDAFMGVNITED